MADVDSLPPGTFCWPELATIDQKAAGAFYRGLFGWDVDTQPIGPTETYTMFKLRGREAGAARTIRPEEKGVPPHWGSYISVVNADETVTRAKALGAKVFAPPFDVMDAGRMAVLQDPTGAVFNVWQPKKHIGTRVQREPGALTWTELLTRDTNAARKFYTDLFGWSAKVGGDGVQAYTEFTAKDQGYPMAGMMDAAALGPRGANIPPNWGPYFQVTDVDATAKKASALGGNVYVPPSDIQNVGRFAVIADPQGAVFAIYMPR
jgi:predicted enzyme related to lactoylglutathione lyase